jgi:hypothetical protein
MVSAHLRNWSATWLKRPVTVQAASRVPPALTFSLRRISLRALQRCSGQIAQKIVIAAAGTYSDVGLCQFPSTLEPPFAGKDVGQNLVAQFQEDAF